jgi:hypothetical protein
MGYKRVCWIKYSICYIKYQISLVISAIADKKDSETHVK